MWRVCMSALHRRAASQTTSHGKWTIITYFSEWSFTIFKRSRDLGSWPIMLITYTILNRFNCLCFMTFHYLVTPLCLPACVPAWLSVCLYLWAGLAALRNILFFNKNTICIRFPCFFNKKSETYVQSPDESDSETKVRLSPSTAAI